MSVAAATRVGPSEIVRRFGSVAVALVCVQLDYFALALALPSMAKELGSTTADLQWTVSAYMIAIGIVMVPGSRLADLLGRKRMLLIGLTIFGLASLWVGLSPTVGSVIAARVVQGVGAGLYFPVAMSLVTNATNAVERPRILGFLTGLAGIGTAAGPILGGGLSSTVGWRWVFLINVPIALGGVIWGHFQLKESTDPALAGHKLINLDWLGVVLLALGIGGLSLGIDDASGTGLGPKAIIPAVVGIIAVVGFVLWERRAKWALIPPVMWRNKAFSALVYAATIANMGIVVVIFVATLYLQQVRGYSGLVAGLMFVPAAIGLSVGGPVSGRLAVRYPTQRVMTVSLVGGALALFALAFSDQMVVYLVLMGIASFLLGLGFQFGNIAIQSVVKPAEAGTAAGVLLTLMVSLGGVAVVIASATIEAIGNGAPTQHASTVTLLSWAIGVGVLGVIFGATQWRKATLAVTG